MSDYKFNVGDKVRINDVYEDRGIPAGTEGVVKSLHAPFVTWPYYVEFAGKAGLEAGTTNGYSNEDVTGLWPCGANELEAVMQFNVGNRVESLNKHDLQRFGKVMQGVVVEVVDNDPLYLAIVGKATPFRVLLDGITDPGLYSADELKLVQ